MSFSKPHPIGALFHDAIINSGRDVAIIFEGEGILEKTKRRIIELTQGMGYTTVPTREPGLEVYKFRSGENTKQGMENLGNAPTGFMGYDISLTKTKDSRIQLHGIGQPEDVIFASHVLRVKKLEFEPLWDAKGNLFYSVNIPAGTEYGEILERHLVYNKFKPEIKPVPQYGDHNVIVLSNLWDVWSMSSGEGFKIPDLDPANPALHPALHY